MVAMQTIFKKPIFFFTLSVSDVVQPNNQLLLKTNSVKENLTNYFTSTDINKQTLGSVKLWVKKKKSTFFWLILNFALLLCTCYACMMLLKGKKNKIKSRISHQCRVIFYFGLKAGLMCLDAKRFGLSQPFWNRESQFPGRATVTWWWVSPHSGVIYYQHFQILLNSSLKRPGGVTLTDPQLGI